MEYFGMYFKQFPNMCQHQDDTVTAKNSLFIFTKCWEAEASAAGNVHSFWEYADLIPVTLSKLTNPCIQRLGKLFWNEAHSKTRRGTWWKKKYFLFSLKDNCILRSSCECRDFLFIHFLAHFLRRIFLLQFHSALKWDECGQINQGNAEGRKIAPFPSQYNLKWERRRRWEGSLF